MTRVKINLNFEGYVSDSSKRIPESPGIYCIYEIKFTPDQKRESVELIYIGQAQRGKNGNLRTRIQAHGRTDFENKFYTNSYKNEGKRIPKVLYAYSYADMSDYSTHEIDVAEAALVFRMQPAENKDFKDAYSKNDVYITLSGKIKDLPDKPFNLDQGTAYDDYFGLDDTLDWLDDLFQE